jgi:hypothetical protein
MTDDKMMAVIDMVISRLEKIDKRLVAMEEKQRDFNERFIKMDARQDLFGFFTANWWKITALVIPLLFFLGEIAIHIRKII